MIRVVSASRLSERDFWNHAALGVSLRRLGHDARLLANVVFENVHGLPEIYNAAIAEARDHEFLVFVHDDVWIDDYFLADRVLEGCQKFDVIGLAGNRRRVAGQPGWAFVNDRFAWDDRANLSGCVAHGSVPFGAVSSFGPVPAECELLDGVFLAARKSVLINRDVRFDSRFRFHFYDMDFCRSARQEGLKLGTWPICITHQSGGAFGSPEWIEACRTYLDKWGG